MAEIKTDENVSGALDQDRTDGISCVSSSRVTWKNFGGPYLIHWPRLNRNNLHLRILSEPLIKDETPDQTVTPIFAIRLDVL